MCKGLLEKEGKLCPFVFKHFVNEKYSGRRQYNLSRTTLKSYLLINFY